MKKKGKFSKVIVALSVLFILIYTIVAFVLQFATQTEVSPTLTTCFYTFFAVEMLSLAGIKTFKTKYDGGYTYEDEDDDIDINESEEEQ